MNIPRKLLSEYNQPVPRYTSYPPASYFHEEFGPQDLKEAILRSNEEGESNVSLYLHIPFCNKICFYCGCNSIRKRDESLTLSYLTALRKEISMFREWIAPHRKVSQVHWGGGTPNSLKSRQIRVIMDEIREQFSFIPDPEIAIECNPAGLSPAYISDLHKAGFTRVSLGIQDFNFRVLNAVNREKPSMEVKKLTTLFREKGMSVNLDFIYGLPFQNVSSFSATIKKAAEIRPDRLVTFSYAHVPWFKPAQKKLETFGLPSPDEKTAMFEEAFNILSAEGYFPVGLDHFALENDELTLARQNKTLHRNFQGYCTRRTTGQVYASGISAISQLHDSYAQNHKDLKPYMEALGEGRLPVEKGYRLSRPEMIRRAAINELMCNSFLDKNQLAVNHNADIQEIEAILEPDSKAMEQFRKQGLLSIDNGSIRVSETGRFFIRNIAAAFDPAVKNTDKKFSKTV